jgi:hypothetical protein
MRVAALVAASLCLSTLSSGCSRQENAGRADRRPDAGAERKAAGEARIGVAKQVAVERRDLRPPFDEKEMIKPLNQFREYKVKDYRKLPNCLDVFSACVAVPFDGMTEAQYKAALSRVAQQPCRVVLRLVEVSAEYDTAQFELITDGGESGLPALERAGNLGNYNRDLRSPFAVNQIKAKRLDAERRSVGDRIVLVGLGYVVAASPWGAIMPKYGVPKGDERCVMLRAFGKPNAYNKSYYEFAFMVRNWFIASQ